MDFCYEGDGVVAVYKRKQLNRDSTSQQKWTKFKIISFILLLLYTNIYTATEHKSHNNLTTPDIQTRAHFEYE